MKEKIEEILDMLFIEETKYKVNVAQSSTVSNTVPDIRSSPEYSAVNIVGKEAVVKLLSTLIQEERKEAVRGFAKKIKNSIWSNVTYHKNIIRTDADLSLQENIKMNKEDVLSGVKKVMKTINNTVEEYLSQGEKGKE